MTQRSETLFPFEAHFSRQVVAQFAGDLVNHRGWFTAAAPGGSQDWLATAGSDLFQRLPAAGTDRAPLEEILAQRIYGLALGYEDLNDHEQLRQDPLLGVLAGKRDLGEPLAGKSTLNRLGADTGWFPCRGTLQQGQLFCRSARHPAGRPLSGSARARTRRNRAGLGRHGHTAARAAGSAFFPRLLRVMCFST